MTPLAGTASVINTDGRPVFNLRRIGCGTVAMLAFDPFQVGNADHRLIAPVWNAILRHSNFQTTIVGPDLPGKINQTLQLLRGYSIPPVSVIVQFFLCMCGWHAILGVAFHFRRHASGWLLSRLRRCHHRPAFVRSNNISTNQLVTPSPPFRPRYGTASPATHATSLLSAGATADPRWSLTATRHSSSARPAVFP